MVGAFTVIVIFDIAPAHMAEFTELVLANARASLDNEPKCGRFDVVVSASGRQVYLYELYESGAAFTAHLATPHFKSFDVATKHMVMAKQVLTGERADGR